MFLIILCHWFIHGKNKCAPYSEFCQVQCIQNGSKQRIQTEVQVAQRVYNQSPH